MRIIAELCEAHEQAKNLNWVQMFWDETQRRAVSLATFVASIMNDNGIKPIVLLCSDVRVGGNSIDTYNALLDILEKVSEC